MNRTNHARTLAWFCTAALLLGAALPGTLQAQSSLDSLPADVPSLPEIKTSGLIYLDPNRFSALQLGLAPDSLTLDKNGIVRYALVIVNASGNASALYEGIRCESAEVKLYARFNADTGWSRTPDPQWRSLFQPGPSRHSLQLARAGLCDGQSPNGTVRQMIEQLRGSLRL